MKTTLRNWYVQTNCHASVSGHLIRRDMQAHALPARFCLNC